MSAPLALIWHMHQPYYRNMRTGKCSMPWVRFHGIHSYYDMVRLHEAHPQVHSTINFVPSLMRQLVEYVREDLGDEFLTLTMLPAEELTVAHKEFLLRHFFMAPPERMIVPYARYFALYERLGSNPSRSDLTDAIRFYSTQDFRDIQVYYNLIWFGFMAKDEMPEIRQMLESGGRFAEGDKQTVINAQKKILTLLLEAIARLARSDHVEICTTPFYHPILPLLIDTNIARRPRPRAVLPEHVQAPELARYQIERALSYMEDLTGVRPRGMWPAEGSVCPEMIPLLVDAGVQWIATDEGILRNSTVAGHDSNSLQPFLAEYQGKSIPILFRHRELSDKIGFVYSGMEPSAAVDDFITKVKELAAHAPKSGTSLITIILDGENPWEHYRQSGKEFLTQLFTRLTAEHIPTTTPARYLKANPPRNRIEKLASGSWINADFMIWSGKPQKNAGWSYIRHTLAELGDTLTPRPAMPPETVAALDSLCAGCGSDWFWWYDDDFSSSFKLEFDKIFRKHLENAFTFLGRDPPHFLFAPIYHFEDSEESFIEPTAFIHPCINGISDSYFEWANAARIDIHRFGGAMAKSGDLIEAIYFGFDLNSFYLRIDPMDKKTKMQLAAGESIIVSLLGKEVSFKLQLAPSVSGLRLVSCSDAPPADGVSQPEFALSNVLELNCPFACFPHTVGQTLTMIVALVSDATERRRYANIRFVIPDETYEQKMWSV